MCPKMFCIYSFNTLFWWENIFTVCYIIQNTNIVPPTGSTMYVDNLLNSVPVPTTRIPWSRGLHAIKDYTLRIACTTNHQLVEITKNMIYSSW